jgi:dihydrofolate reductase
MSITLVAITDMADGIGDGNNNLLYDIKEDLKRFKEVTNGKAVVMGRKTWDSLPSKPLPFRKNIVLSREKDLKLDGATVLNSINDVLLLSKSEEVMIIGGEEIYSKFINHADKMILTHVHSINVDARKFFPKFEYKDWNVKIVKKVEEDGDTPPYSFVEYARK